MNARHYTASRRPQGLHDPAEVGAKLVSLRAAMSSRLGIKSASDACSIVYATTGVEIAEDTWYRVELGKQLPSQEAVDAIVLTFRPEGGIHYFVRDALAPEWRAVWDEIHGLDSQGSPIRDVGR